MTLVDAINEKRNLIKGGVEKLLEKNKNIVEKVGSYGPFPRVYLVGEAHDEDSHIQFVCDLVRTISPAALFWEKVDFGVIEPLKEGYTFDFMLNSFGLDNYKEDIIKIIPKIKPVDQNLQKYYGNPSALLHTPVHLLSEEEYDLFTNAFSKLIVREFSPIKSQLEKKIEDYINSLTLSKNLDECSILSGVIGFLTEPTPSRLLWMKKWNKQEDLLKLLGERLYDMLNFYAFINDRKNVPFNDQIQTIKYQILGYKNDPDRKKFNYELLDICSKHNVPIHPFDSEEAKNEYIKIIRRIKEGMRANSLTSQDLDSLNKDLDRLDIIRENAMESFLLEWFPKSHDANAVTYGGGDHLREDSPILAGLKSTGIPYCTIILKPTGEAKGDYSLWLLSRA